MTIYEQLKERSLPFIEAYQNDLLEYDKEMLEKNPGVPFLHFTGSTGTYIHFLNAADTYPPPGERVLFLFGTATRGTLLDSKITSIQNMKNVNRQSLILYFDGVLLKQITQERAERIALDYMAKIRREWDNAKKEIKA